VNRYHTDPLYRGDSRDTATIFRDGFQTRGLSNDLLAHAKDDMTPPSNFVSTSTSQTQAMGFTNTGDHLYTIDQKVSGYDVNASLGSDSPYPLENEVAVPNGIPGSNIIGAQQVLPGGNLGPMIPNPGYCP